eukprot:PhF_6_TR1471/c0_g1_i1/m.2650
MEQAFRCYPPKLRHAFMVVTHGLHNDAEGQRHFLPWDIIDDLPDFIGIHSYLYFDDNREEVELEYDDLGEQAKEIARIGSSGRSFHLFLGTTKQHSCLPPNFLSNCHSLVSLDTSGLIAAGITSIEAGCFHRCYNLTSLDLSGLKNVTSIGDHFLTGIHSSCALPLGLTNRKFFREGCSMCFKPMEDKTSCTVTCLGCTTLHDRLIVLVGSTKGLSCYEPKMHIPTRRWFQRFESGVREITITSSNDLARPNGVLVMTMDWVVYVLKSQGLTEASPVFDLGVDTKAMASGVSVVMTVTSPYGNIINGVTVATLYSDNTLSAWAIQEVEAKGILLSPIETRMRVPSKQNVKDVRCMAVTGFQTFVPPSDLSCTISVGYFTGTLFIATTKKTTRICGKYSETPITCIHFSPDYSMMAVTVTHDDVLMMDVDGKKLHTATYAKGPRENHGVTSKRVGVKVPLINASDLDPKKLAQRILRFNPVKYEMTHQYNDWFVTYALDDHTETAVQHSCGIKLYTLHTQATYVCIYDNHHTITLYGLK